VPRLVASKLMGLSLFLVPPLTHLLGNWVASIVGGSGGVIRLRLNLRQQEGGGQERAAACMTRWTQCLRLERSAMTYGLTAGCIHISGVTNGTAHVVYNLHTARQWLPFINPRASCLSHSWRQAQSHFNRDGRLAWHEMFRQTRHGMFHCAMWRLKPTKERLKIETSMKQQQMRELMKQHCRRLRHCEYRNVSDSVHWVSCPTMSSVDPGNRTRTSWLPLVCTWGTLFRPKYCWAAGEGKDSVVDEELWWTSHWLPHDAAKTL